MPPTHRAAHSHGPPADDRPSTHDSNTGSTTSDSEGDIHPPWLSGPSPPLTTPLPPHRTGPTSRAVSPPFASPRDARAPVVVSAVLLHMLYSCIYRSTQPLPADAARSRCQRTSTLPWLTRFLATPHHPITIAPHGPGMHALVTVTPHADPPGDHQSMFANLENSPGWDDPGFKEQIQVIYTPTCAHILPHIFCQHLHAETLHMRKDSSNICRSTDRRSPGKRKPCME